MISAYFDDSGTHDDSDVVVYGGLIGTEDQWQQFELAWQFVLDAPLPGKLPIPRFHMSHCMAQKGKVFGGYTKTEAVLLASKFIKIILDSGVSIYGCALFRADWDELGSGPIKVLADQMIG